MKPTRKQVELLNVLNPFEGNTTYDEAAEILGISKAGVQQRMMNLKRRCPEIYQKFRKLRKDINKGQRAINYPVIMDPIFIEKLNRLGKVREIF